MKIAAIVNPVSGKSLAGRAWPALLDAAGLRDEVITLWTEYSGHAEFLAARALREGCGRVIAVGGDGTLFEVVNGLWKEAGERMPSVGMVPFGTGCDYVRNFEVGKTRLDRLLTAAGDGTVGVSLGRCRLTAADGGLREKVFAMVLGAGFDADIIRRFRSRRLVRSGWTAYALSAIGQLRKARPYRMSGEMDGRPFRANSPVFVAALGGYFGKGIRIAPHAHPASDMFELVWGDSIGRLALAFLLPLCRFGLHPKYPGIRFARASRIVLDSDPPAWIEADGELPGKTPLEIEVIPGAFRFAAKGVRSAGRRN